MWKEYALHFWNSHIINSPYILANTLSDKLEAKARRIRANTNHNLQDWICTPYSIYIHWLLADKVGVKGAWENLILISMKL